MPVITYTTIKSSTNSQATGSKAESLSMLNSLGLHVPPWIVISSTEFEEHVPVEIRQQTPQNVTEFINTITINPSLIDRISNWINNNDMHDDYFAIRSSICIDGAFEHTFAGQLKTNLYVPLSQIPEAILGVWASPFTSSACAYRAQWGLSPESIRIAVIIQKMIDSNVSGVSMGFDPYTGSRSSVSISSMYGVSHGISSGRGDFDQFSIDFTGKQPSRISKVFEKRNKVIFNQVTGSGTMVSPVSFALRSKPSLTAEQILTIAETTRTISTRCGKPQMLDWTISDDKLYILQSRPVTSISAIPDTTDIRRQWTLSQMASLCDENASPLTYSITRKFTTDAFYSFCTTAILNTGSKIQRGTCEILGYINGNVRVNQDNYNKVASVLPFHNETTDTNKKVRLNWSLLISHVHFLMDILALSLNYNKRSKNRITKTNTLDNQPLSLKKPHQLVDLFVSLETELNTLWKSLVKNDYYLNVINESLSKVSFGFGTEHYTMNLRTTTSIKNSVDQIKSLCSIVNAITQRPSVREMFLEYDDTDVCSHLHLNSTVPPATEEISILVVRKMILDHIQLHFNSIYRSSMFEQHSFDKILENTVALIRSYLKADIDDICKANRINDVSLDNNIDHLANPLSYIQKLHCNFLFIFFRQLLDIRTTIHSRQSHLCRLIQQVFQTIGNKFYAEGIIDEADDLKYLTRDEIVDYINGHSVTSTPEMLISIRKKESHKNNHMAYSDSFGTHGIVYHANSLDNHDITQKQSIPLFQGIGNGMGRVCGKVHIAEKAQMIENSTNLILVVHNSDPDWIPFLPLIKGIIVEHGSIVSELANSCLLLGIPMAISVNGSIKDLHNGDSIELDTSSSEAKILFDHSI